LTKHEGIRSPTDKSLGVSIPRFKSHKSVLATILGRCA